MGYQNKKREKKMRGRQSGKHTKIKNGHHQTGDYDEESEDEASDQEQINENGHHHIKDTEEEEEDEDEDESKSDDNVVDVGFGGATGDNENNPEIYGKDKNDDKPPQNNKDLSTIPLRGD